MERDICNSEPAEFSPDAKYSDAFKRLISLMLTKNVESRPSPEMVVAEFRNFRNVLPPKSQTSIREKVTTSDSESRTGPETCKPANKGPPQQALSTKSADIADSLVKAVDSDDIHEIREVLKSPPALKLLQNEQFWLGRGHRGDSLLHHAVVKEKTTIVEMLVDEFQCRVDVRNKHGSMPIHTAAGVGNWTIVDFFIQKQPSLLKETLAEGKNILHQAIRSNKLELIENLIKEKPKLLSERMSDEKRGLTPFLYAVENSLLDVAAQMVKHRPDLLSQVDTDGNNALHIAIKKNDVTMAKHLVTETSIDVNKRNKSGRTPLAAAVKHGNMAVVKLLLDSRQISTDLVDENASGDNILFLACGLDKMDIFTALANRFPEMLNCVNAKGDNVLSRAVTGGNIEIVNFLINKFRGSNLKKMLAVKGEMGRTPLLHAACLGHGEIVKALLNAGAKAKDVDSDGNTALHLAGYFGFPDCFKILKDAGCKVKGVNNNFGMSVADIVNQGGKQEMVDLLSTIS